MADVARLNLTEKGAEARLRSLMEDLVEAYVAGRPLSLAVWFGKSSHGDLQHLLLLYAGPSLHHLASETVPLLWKTGSQGPPFVEVTATSVDYFSHLLTSGAREAARFLEEPEILHLDKAFLKEPILQSFKIVTEPPGLMKGWYVDADQARARTLREILSSRGDSRPDLGLVKVWESPNFENCRGLIQIEIDHKWLPLSLAGLRNFNFFHDLQAGKPGLFLFRGGSMYQILKFEEKRDSLFSSLVLQPLADDRYPEVYLRSVYPSEKPAD